MRASGRLEALGSSTNLASHFNQAWSRPHKGQLKTGSLSGRAAKLSGSISIPVDISRPVSGHLTLRTLIVCPSPSLRELCAPPARRWDRAIFSQGIGDRSNFLEKNAACLNLCGQPCPAFGKVGKAPSEAWVIGACRPRPTFLRVLATAFSIARHVTPPWAHIPRKTIQSLRRFGNQDCLRAAQHRRDLQSTERGGDGNQTKSFASLHRRGRSHRRPRQEGHWSPSDCSCVRVTQAKPWWPPQVPCQDNARASSSRRSACFNSSTI